MSDAHFTASNGIMFRWIPKPDYYGGPVLHYSAAGINWLAVGDGEYGGTGFSSGSELHAALAEFYRHEEDVKLGRWRSKRFPHIYVRPFPGKPDIVGVVKDNEDGLAYGTYSRRATPTVDPMSIAAIEYFKEHPNLEPWTNATNTEIWLFKGVFDSKPYPFTKTYEGWMNVSGTEMDHTPYAEERDTSFTPRRIWPEEKS